MSILAQLRYQTDSFTQSESKVATYILEHLDSVVEMSSQELADSCQVSQSSIVKFSQKLGCKGFTAFKMLLSEAMGRQQAITDRRVLLHNQIQKNDTLQDVAQKLTLEKYDAILQTTNRLNDQDFYQVIDWLDNATRIQVTAVGNSALVAKDLCYKLQKIGLFAVSEYDTHIQISMANTLNQNDVLVAISFSGDRNDVVFAAEIAKQHGAKVIALTGCTSNPLREIADIALETHASEEGVRSSSISSRTAQHTLCDLIFLSLLQRRDEDGQLSNLIQDTQGVVDIASRRKGKKAEK